MACWSTEAAISLKRIKIEQKVRPPYGLLFPKIGVPNPHSKLQRYYLRNGQRYTDCKFGWYIQKSIPTKAR